MGVMLTSLADAGLCDLQAKPIALGGLITREIIQSTRARCMISIPLPDSWNRVVPVVIHAVHSQAAQAVPIDEHVRRRSR